MSSRRAILQLLAAAFPILSAPNTPRLERMTLRVPFWPDSGVEDQSVPPLVATVNGETARVVRVLGPQTDLLLILVLDLAGDLNPVDTARQALIEQLEQLPANVSCGLMRAQDGLKVLVDPGAERGKITEELKGITVSGRAGLLDAIEPVLHVCDSVGAKAAVRTAVLFISDSNIANYREDFTNPVVNSSDSRDMSRRFPEALIKERIQQISARIAAAQTPMFLVHLAYQSDRLSEAYQTGLLDLATMTGGAAEFSRTTSEIGAFVNRMLGSARSHYSAQIEHQPKAKSKSKELQVELAAEGVPLRYRKTFALKGAKK